MQYDFKKKTFNNCRFSQRKAELNKETVKHTNYGLKKKQASLIRHNMLVENVKILFCNYKATFLELNIIEFDVW